MLVINANKITSELRERERHDKKKTSFAHTMKYSIIRNKRELSGQFILSFFTQISRY